MPASEDYTPLDTLKRYASFPRRTIEEGLSSLATLPQRAIENSRQAWETGTYNPGPTLEAALLPMGTGAIAGAPVRAGETALGAGPIRAYHSSPHDFDKFDLAKIGTGEGAQVYGHGLYFAENPAVSGQGGQYWNQFMRRFKGEEEAAARRLQMSGFDREAAARLTQEAKDRYVTEPSKYLDPATIAERQATLQRQHELLTSGKPVGPRTYEVNINADPAHMLDWDKGLHRQSPEVQKALSRYGIEADPAAMKAYDDALYEALHGNKPSVKMPNMPWDPVGSDIYHSRNLGRTKPEATERLREAGIPGIRYLDQGSRNATPILKTDKAGNVISSEYPPPSSNYVIFNPSILDIIKKYGLAGLASAPALTSSLRDRENTP